jgi:predicted deacylase
LIRSADFYIDLHTAGTTLQLSPLAGYTLHPDQSVLDQQRAMARVFNLPIVWGTSGRLDGRSLSVARDARVPAIYAEYGGSAICRPDGVAAYVDGCLNVAVQLDMLDRELPPSAVRYAVEDDRDDSGHLQVQHPAPCEGYFEPTVALNHPVERGQTLGQVVDALGQRRESITAQDSGIVLMLRTFPSVTAGDALVALLPISEPGTVRYEREKS